MELKDWFDKGFDKEQYIDSMKSHKENLKHVYESFTVPNALKDRLKSLETDDLRAIVITEDWCGDAMVNIPILMKLADEVDMDLRFVLRDSNLELIDQYLTNGTSRAIPIFIFIDKDGGEKAVWGPRAEELQAYVDKKRAGLPDKDADDFKEKQGEMIKELTEKYTTDSDTWLTIAESIVSKLEKNL